MVLNTGNYEGNSNDGKLRHGTILLNILTLKIKPLKLMLRHLCEIFWFEDYLLYGSLCIILYYYGGTHGILQSFSHNSSSLSLFIMWLLSEFNYHTVATTINFYTKQLHSCVRSTDSETVVR